VKKIVQALLEFKYSNIKLRKKTLCSPRKESLRISINIHGGTKRLITIADELNKLGYNVKLLRQHGGRDLDWYNTNVRLIDIKLNFETDPTIQEQKIPDADVLINYGNNRFSKIIDKFSKRKGIKYSLFMHFGVHCKKLDVSNSKLENIKNICTTNWIREHLTKYDKKNVEVISF
jgi:hypothetical protein